MKSPEIHALPGRRPAGRRKSTRRERDTLWIVGEPRTSERVSAALHGLDVRIRSARRITDLPSTLPETAAILLVPPLKRLSMQRALRGIRTERERVPAFVVVPEDTLALLLRRLYAAGAAGVFRWPAERSILCPVLVDAVGLRTRETGVTRYDRALGRTLRRRLRPLAHRTGGARGELRVAVRGAVAYLTGSVDGLWRRRRAIEIASETRGIRGVVARGLDVRPTRHSDREVARRARSVLRGASSIASDGLTIAVDHGHVAVEGVVDSRLEAVRAMELLANVEGVRSVANLTSESRRRRPSELLVARQLREAVPDLMPSDDVHVELMGGVAVLSGRVSLLSTRRRIARIAEEAPGVERVVDKVQVDPVRWDPARPAPPV